MSAAKASNAPATAMATATSPASAPITRRYDFVLLFDVRNGNPNGDPDAGNAPRIDPETGHGLVSDVCLKRKIRNFITLAKAKADGTVEPGYDIYVKEKAILNRLHESAYVALKVKTDEEAKSRRDEARDWMCQTFYDIRSFGAVMSTGEKSKPRQNAGQVRGPVQIAFAYSADPIVALEQSITRMAVTNERDEQKERTMGRKEIIPYALYRCHGFVNPFLAAQTGFSEADLDLLWKAIESMFEHDRSAARGEMATRKLLVFEHESALGNAPAHRLFERVTVARKDASRPARDFADYEVKVVRDLPAGVTLHERL